MMKNKQYNKILNKKIIMKRMKIINWIKIYNNNSNNNNYNKISMILLIKEILLKNIATIIINNFNNDNFNKLNKNCNKI